MFKKISIFAAIVFGLLILGIFLFAKDFNVTLTEDEVQHAIDERIMVGPIRSLGIDITLKSASLDFRSNDTAAIDVNLDAEGFGYSGNLSGQFTSGLRYKEPELFLNNILPVNIEITTDTETEGKFQDIKNVTSDFLNRQRQEMLSDEAKTSLDSITERNEEKIKEVATSATRKFFEGIPIYDLKKAGLKGSLASLALKDVRFTEDAAIVTLSPVQALIKILSFCVLIFFVFWIYIGRFLPLRHEKKHTSP